DRHPGPDLRQGSQHLDRSPLGSGRMDPVAPGAPDLSHQTRPEDLLLGLRSVSKSFGSIRALVDVDFELRADEIVAVVGDNGAGKSTMVKILSGVYPPDDGTVPVR